MELIYVRICTEFTMLFAKQIHGRTEKCYLPYFRVSNYRDDLVFAIENRKLEPVLEVDTPRLVTSRILSFYKIKRIRPLASLAL